MFNIILDVFFIIFYFLIESMLLPIKLFVKCFMSAL